MRAALLFTCLSLLSSTALAQSPVPVVPRGKLSDAARPTAYRIDMTILPDQPNFSGHDEIDAVVKAPTRSLYIHGRNLHVSKAVALAGGKSIAANWSQVDPTGVVRLDFATPLPAGQVTLAFDFTGAFGDNPSGLYRIKVGDQWYSWTQFESIDARAAFPSFDEPGFKTPFTVSITTKPGYKTVSNAPEAAVTKARRSRAPQLRADQAAADLSRRDDDGSVHRGRGRRAGRCRADRSRCRSARSRPGPRPASSIM